MNCGCDARREVMFTYGQPTRTEAAILAIAGFALLWALHKKGTIG